MNIYIYYIYNKATHVLDLPWQFHCWFDYCAEQVDLFPSGAQTNFTFKLLRSTQAQQSAYRKNMMCGGDKHVANKNNFKKFLTASRTLYEHWKR